jgi:hypothetical protein
MRSDAVFCSGACKVAAFRAGIKKGSTPKIPTLMQDTKVERFSSYERYTELDARFRSHEMDPDGWIVQKIVQSCDENGGYSGEATLIRAVPLGRVT